MIAYKGKAHPIADRFPMLGDDDLLALAEDIKANGQRSPIVLTPDMLIADGRNRHAACDIADVPPTTVVDDSLTTDEAVAAFVISANLQRRDMTAGQKAMMAVQVVQIEPVRGLAKIAGVAHSDIAKAKVIAEYMPDEVDGVIGGTTPFHAAYKEAAEIKAEADHHKRLMVGLKDRRPDLLELVHTGSLPIEDAITIMQSDYEKEQEFAKQVEEKWDRLIGRLNVGYLAWMSVLDPEVQAEAEARWQVNTVDITGDVLRQFGENMIALSETWRKKR